MKKYFEIFRVSILSYFVYRFSFIIWRLRNAFGLIFLYFLWTSIYLQRISILSYTKPELISYILLINMVSSVNLSTRTSDIASDILSGDFMNYLLRPTSFLKYVMTGELVDKIINGLSSLIEIIILILAFKPTLFIQPHLINYVMFLITLIIGAILSFFISILFSFLAFWTTEIWSPRFIYQILVSMLAGSFFPLDILSKKIYEILLLTPFPYLIFLPTRIYIKGFSSDLIQPIVISIIWCFILYKIVQIVWRRGLITYGAHGR